MAATPHLGSPMTCTSQYPLLDSSLPCSVPTTFQPSQLHSLLSSMAISLPWPFLRPTESDPPAKSLKRSPSAMLRYYATPGIPPPSARLDPSLKRRETQPVRFWDLWRYALIAASKATEVTGDVLSHHIWGPRKKSWGIEMTIITSLMRGAARHSALVDIGTVRMLMSIAGFVPLPSDALVTPVTFRVRRRNLRGILAEFDSLETGSRELSGEWVVGKKTWQRLQSEWKASKKSKEDAAGSMGSKTPAKKKERVILYIHGGAYYLSSAATQRLISIPLSKYTDARVFALDYRLAPETRFPGPLHDVVSGYLRLVDDLHIPPENIILAGDSAGGGLSLALLMYLRDNEYPLPAGAILMSPWVDLTMSCDSWDSNAPFDVLSFPAPDDHMNPVALYLGDHMEKYFTHPYASPLFGDLTGLPPLLIQVGDAEVLRDEITLLAHKATLAGVEVRHELYEDAIHLFQAYPFLEAAERSFKSCRDFLRHTLPHIQTRSPQQLDGAAEAVLEDEIDNEKAYVVSGDGVETAPGMEEVKDRFDVDDGERTESDSDDSTNLRTFPSWGRSQAWSPPNDEDIDMANNGPSKLATQPPASLSSQDEMSLTHRFKSAFSVFLPESSQPPPPPPPPPARVRNRSLSNQSANGQAVAANRRLHAFSMSSVTSVPPSPSIRRCNASHPDITSLVEEWASSGPANQTLTFKPS